MNSGGAAAVKVGIFTPSVIIATCRELGYFSELEVIEVPVASSPGQFKSLASGDLDLAVTSPDNCIAYRFLSENPLNEIFDVRIHSAIDRGLGLSLARIKAQDAEQNNLIFGVDVPSSGFAYVGYALLKRWGIESYHIQSFGSTPKRLNALLEGQCNITMLNAGNEIKAADRGATIIASVAELGPYLGTVTATIGEPSSAVTQVIEAMAQVIDQICSGKLKTLIVEVTQQVLDLNEEQALKHYNVMIDPVIGLVAGKSVDSESLDNLITLRKEFSPTPELEEIPARYRELVPSVLTAS